MDACRLGRIHRELYQPVPSRTSADWSEHQENVGFRRVRRGRGGVNLIHY